MNEEIWLTTEQVAAAEGKSIRAIQKRIERGYYPKENIKRMSKPTGGKYFLINTGAIPKDVYLLPELSYALLRDALLPITPSDILS